MTIWTFNQGKLGRMSLEIPLKYCLRFSEEEEGPYHEWVFLAELGSPQDENDKTDIAVTGVVWAHDQATHLVISYKQQGVV